MSVDNAYAVILAGGRGERFWPLSVYAKPKQFLNLFGERSLLGMAVDRLEGCIPPERTLVITSADLVEETRRTAPELPAENVVGEPFGRDTAAAVALAAALVEQRDPEGVFCILTADHIMGDLPVFQQTLVEGLKRASEESVIITIGILPTAPDTGFGYIEAGEACGVVSDVSFFKTKGFVEKPDAVTAQGYLDAGCFFWNAGMFIWSAATVREGFSRFRPELVVVMDRIVSALDAGRFATEFEGIYEGLEKISIDYALMEHAENVLMVEGRFKWDDVGSWSVLPDYFPADDCGNVRLGRVETLDAKNNVVVSEGRATVLLGVEDLVVVHAEDATLICPRDKVGEIKKAVAQMRAVGGYDDVL